MVFVKLTSDIKKIAIYVTKYLRLCIFFSHQIIRLKIKRWMCTVQVNADESMTNSSKLSAIYRWICPRTRAVFFAQTCELSTNFDREACLSRRITSLVSRQRAEKQVQIGEWRFARSNAKCGNRSIFTKFKRKQFGAQLKVAKTLFSNDSLDLVWRKCRKRCELLHVYSLKTGDGYTTKAIEMTFVSSMQSNMKICSCAFSLQSIS